MLGAFFIGIVILLFVGVPIGLLFYFIPKKLGYPKIAKYLAIAYGLFVLTVFFLTVFEDLLFTKSDAKEIVEAENFYLEDKFDILENKSASAIGDYYHTFTLKISEKDKQNAIKLITTSKSFTPGNVSNDSVISWQTERNFARATTKDCETENDYIRVKFTPGMDDYARINTSVFISKTENKLIFLEIDE
ncbi:MAG: hypothetical protein H7257_01290 [Taibaiella sp.]|nr:hypothetical protein [Taibaiella sp.]